MNLNVSHCLIGKLMKLGRSRKLNTVSYSNIFFKNYCRQVAKKIISIDKKVEPCSTHYLNNMVKNTTFNFQKPSPFSISWILNIIWRCENDHSKKIDDIITEYHFNTAYYNYCNT